MALFRFGGIPAERESSTFPTKLRMPSCRFDNIFCRFCCFSTIHLLRHIIHQTHFLNLQVYKHTQLREERLTEWKRRPFRLSVRPSFLGPPSFLPKKKPLQCFKSQFHPRSARSLLFPLSLPSHLDLPAYLPRVQGIPATMTMESALKW